MQNLRLRRMPQAVTLDVPAELIKARVDPATLVEIEVFEPRLALWICTAVESYLEAFFWGLVTSIAQWLIWIWMIGFWAVCLLISCTGPSLMDSWGHQHLVAMAGYRLGCPWSEIGCIATPWFTTPNYAARGARGILCSAWSWWRNATPAQCRVQLGHLAGHWNCSDGNDKFLVFRQLLAHRMWQAELGVLDLAQQRVLDSAVEPLRWGIKQSPCCL